MGEKRVKSKMVCSSCLRHIRRKKGSLNEPYCFKCFKRLFGNDYGRYEKHLKGRK